ncbi:MAG TPA: AAA family ATPase [Steroidobacteraceae bacterium]|jgi:hypothetical protein
MDSGLGSIIGLLVFAIVISLVVYIFNQARKNGLLAKELAAKLAKETELRVAAEAVQSAASGGPVDLTVLRKAQEMRDDADFELNAAQPVSIESLTFANAGLLVDGTWQVQPGINVLLGRNGYCKSLLLRELAALLSRSEQQMLGKGTSSRINVRVSVGDKASDIVRGPQGFERSLGPVPVLAIPDSRFVNRSEDALRASPDPYSKLARHGAEHFVEQLPYHTVVQGLLHSLCLDYVEKPGGFEQPIFKLLTEVFRELTDSSFSFKSVERIDPTGFHLNVITEGNQYPVPIQAASQGTLSVLAVFGLIYRQLEALARYDKSSTPLLLRRTIVIIDELDAHLHPAWQQRVCGLLRKHFPNLQFIISAHSPLLVAGVGRGEASVLRKHDKQFSVVTYDDRDFIGATAADIYNTIFNVADGDDDVFIEHSKLAAAKVDNGPEIARLRSKQSLNMEEEAELRRLQQQDVYMRRVQVIEQNRTVESQQVVNLETECSRLRNQVRKLQSELAAAKQTPVEQGAAR